jgi:hypothetical protein
MAKKTGKVVKGAVDFVRDGFGLVVTGTLGYSLPVIGGIISYFISPAIASTPEGKDFNRMFAVLVTFDALLERLFGGRGVI